MKKNFLKQLAKGELSPTDTLFYTGIINVNSGLIKLAAEIERGKQQENAQINIKSNKPKEKE